MEDEISDDDIDNICENRWSEADWISETDDTVKPLILAFESIFTALHVMQTRYCDEISVRPSVCHTRGLWQNGRKIGPDFYTIRKNI